MSQKARILHGPNEDVFNLGKENYNVGLEFQLDNGKMVTVHYLWEIDSTENKEDFYGVCADPYEAVIVRKYNPNEEGPYEGSIELSPSIQSTLLPPVTKDAFLKVAEIPEDLEDRLQDARANCENNNSSPPTICLSVERENGRTEDIVFAVDMHHGWRRGKKLITIRGNINTPFGKIPVRGNLNFESGTGYLETLLED